MKQNKQKKGRLHVKSLFLPFLWIAVLLGLTGCSGKEQLKIHCFDAGKADAFLITTGSTTILIDTGEDEEGDIILDYLESQKITTIDYMIITHFDKDHVGGADHVLNGITVSNVIQSNSPKDSTDYAEYVQALKDASITPVTLREEMEGTFGQVTMTIYPPEKETYKKNESNNSSLVIRMVHGENSFLFAGDAQDARLSELINMGNLESTFLKVPYHGHAQDNLEDFLDMVHPSYAVITSSDKEPEDEETMELLNALGTKTWLTREGDIDVTSNGKKIVVKQ